jgi:hypothetical protein
MVKALTVVDDEGEVRLCSTYAHTMFDTMIGCGRPSSFKAWVNLRIFPGKGLRESDLINGGGLRRRAQFSRRLELTRIGPNEANLANGGG